MTRFYCHLAILRAEQNKATGVSACEITLFYQCSHTEKHRVGTSDMNAYMQLVDAREDK